MNQEHEHNAGGYDELERQLAAESVWTGEEAPGLWEKALGTSRSRRFGRGRVWKAILSVAAVLAIGVVSVGMLLPRSVGGGAVIEEALAASQRVYLNAGVPPAPPLDGRSVDAATRVAILNFGPPASRAAGASTPGDWQYDKNGDAALRYREADSTGRVIDGSTPAGATFMAELKNLAPRAQGDSRTPVADARQVVRKAQMTLAVPDVRAAFLQAQMIVSDATGEFVQESSLTGQESDKVNQGGTLTLRVAATRLSAVLNRLRELGAVVAENSGGEDVTDQMVDLEARFRNEQRIEMELLSLLDQRMASPLKDVMEVRQSLDSVRERIEKIAAQKERLSRMVSLATVLVMIRHQDAGVPKAVAAPVEPTFTDRLGKSWSRGVDSLERTVASLVEGLISGLFAWIGLGIAGVIGWAVVKRVLREMSGEPAPKV